MELKCTEPLRRIKVNNIYIVKVSSLGMFSFLIIHLKYGSEKITEMIHKINKINQCSMISGQNNGYF